MFPPAPLLERSASENCVLPLSEEILTSTGNRIHELPVGKGQFIFLALGVYQRWVIIEQSQNKFPVKFVDQNLRPINPFRVDFPHCDIFSCMTPDLLHELHNGVFGDHIVKWATQATLGQDDEIDRRFRVMTPHPTLRHFTKGISCQNLNSAEAQ
ncbi:hypothetical protein B0H19DRAFT_1201204 [Mycena capillaripes]|nr:hypothetical protein B0H19DRAFT_1201204 [Mycena capillaripes]